MSVEGPYSVLPGGMPGFPLNDESHSWHGHTSKTPSAHPVVAAGRTDRGERSRTPTYDMPPSSSQAVGGAIAPSDNVDESLPALLAHPRLRSVSSLVFSSDIEDHGSVLIGSPARGPPRRQSARDHPSWSVLLDSLAETAPAAELSQQAVNLNLEHLPPLPASTPALQRDQSFPPPDHVPDAAPTLAGLPSFPPHDEGVGSTQEHSLLGSPGWLVPSSDRPGVAAVEDDGGRKYPGRRCKEQRDIGLDIGTRDPTWTDQRDEHAPEYHVMDDTDVDISTSRRHQGMRRRPSFESLLAMIPGLNGNVQQPPPEAVPPEPEPVTSVKREISPSAPALRTRPGRTAKRQDLGRRPARGREAARAPKFRVSKKVDEAAGAAGPPGSKGGPIDVVKKAKRKAAIERYLYKKSRRQFADETRAASPSRSRPKAAQARPRVCGKFVKSTPDFLPVTSVGDGPNASVTSVAITPGGRSGHRNVPSSVKRGARFTSGRSETVPAQNPSKGRVAVGGENPFPRVQRV